MSPAVRDHTVSPATRHSKGQKSNLNEAIIKPSSTATASSMTSNDGAGVTVDGVRSSDRLPTTLSYAGCSSGGGGVRPSDKLPTTLSYLVLFWDELCKSTRHKISQKPLLHNATQIIPPVPCTEPSSPSTLVKSKKKEEHGIGKLVAKKARDGAKLMGALRGNLFGAAADQLIGKLGGPAGSKLAAGAVSCELCGDEFPHPVTYHMRQAHPGCGQPAGGQGYNSGGNYCGGWAGNCGDGGVGGSTWYLMCEGCRTNHLRDKKKLRPGPTDHQARKPVTSLVTSSTARKKAPVTALTSPSSHAGATSTEPHWIVYSNAMFVLDLAARSAYNSSMSVTGTSHVTGQLTNQTAALSSVCEDTNSSLTPAVPAFDPVPFLYLQLHGAASHDSAFSDDVDDDVRYFHRPGKTPHHHHHHHHHYEAGSRAVRSGEHLDRSVSDSSRHYRAAAAVGGQVSEEDERGNDPDEGLKVGVRTVFQRSVSEMAAISSCTDIGHEQHDDNGLSLVRRPSTEMSRLIESLDGVEQVSDHISRLSVVSFVTESHDLDVLRHVLLQAARRAACRTYGLQALNWLVRNISQTSCLHDLLWHLVTALSSTGPAAAVPAASATDEDEPAVTELSADPDQDVAVCFHPASDVCVAGEMTTRPLVSAFHTLLQSVADVMMHVPASAVQRMAVRCWSVQFEPSDHGFLHGSHVFSHISRILSSADELATSDVRDTADNTVRVEHMDDLTSQADIKASSRQAMVAGLTDHSTETFWESGDEDKNKTKTLSVSLVAGAACRPRIVCVHVDNARDIGNKVSAVTMSAGLHADSVQPVRSVDLDQRHVAWVTAWLPADTATRHVRIELRGPDNTLRVRQLRLLGVAVKPTTASDVSVMCGELVAQRQCNNETLSVFRLLTSLVFGRRLVTETDPASESRDRLCHDVDLKEHMVGILFSHSSELTRLQRQVCAHIVNSIHVESARVRSLWQSDSAGLPVSDAYCFELLSLLLALSGSSVGRRYVAQQSSLIEDLVCLLHTASPRVQRQVVSLLRRVLPDIAPRSFAAVLGIHSLPPADLSSLVQSSSSSTAETPRRGVLDVLLACIAKALTVNVKSRLPGVKSRSTTSVSLSDCLPPPTSSQLWWLRGTVPIQLAESIIQLLLEMASGQMGSEWAAVTKSAVAAPVVSLSRLAPTERTVDTCMQSVVMWLALAGLCVLSTDHVEQLSTGRFASSSPAAAAASTGCPTCANHDDNETLATIVCTSGCGSLCTECDRVLHLSMKCRSHHRQVLKEEEESIRVDLHEGCGRVKLYWLLALADSKTLKAVVELRQVTGATPDSQHPSTIPASSSAPAGAALVSQDTCRFCGCPAASRPLLDVLLPGAVCTQSECIEYGRNACTRTLSCGHLCAGVRNESPCLPCLHGCLQDHKAPGGTGTSPVLRQDADDMCMICFADALSAAPVILLHCGHAFHYHCCRQAVERRWPGPRITFTFMLCPICKTDMAHASLEALIEPARALREDVRRKARMRLDYEGLASRSSQASTVATAAAADGAVGRDLTAYAMDRYAYYVCYKCTKAYYGGEARCERAPVDPAALTDEYDPSELVCGACSDVTRAQMCVRHGADFLEYKCRYCCSVAVFFCFGTTHFCAACHDDFQRVTAMSRSQLPHCPAGPRATQLTGDECPLHVQHPVTGDEFALGCGVCRNAHTF